MITTWLGTVTKVFLGTSLEQIAFTIHTWQMLQLDPETSLRRHFWMLMLTPLTVSPKKKKKSCWNCHCYDIKIYVVLESLCHKYFYLKPRLRTPNFQTLLGQVSMGILQVFWESVCLVLSASTMGKRLCFLFRLIRWGISQTLQLGIKRKKRKKKMERKQGGKRKEKKKISTIFHSIDFPTKMCTLLPIFETKNDY